MPIQLLHAEPIFEIVRHVMRWLSSLMITWLRMGLFLAIGMSCSFLRGETWQTTRGGRCEGDLVGVYGSVGLVVGKEGSALVPLEVLDDAGLHKVLDFLAAQPPHPPPFSTSSSKVAKDLRGRLQVLRDGKLVPFEWGERAEPQIYLAYFGAHWCGPCREFSPDLVRAYTELKQLAPDFFELVFISNDRDVAEQRTYVDELKMPWPVLKYSQLGRVPSIEQWESRGIPNLVAVTREGKIIFHSYHGDEYLGPQSVLNDFTDLLRSTMSNAASTKRALHRLSVLQRLRSLAGGSGKVQPYLVSLDRTRYQTLEFKELMVTLSIDECGHVADAKFEPQLPAVIESQIARDTEGWLFLPAIENGQPKKIVVKMPVRF